MGLVLLVVLYLATAVAVAALAWRLGGRPSWLAAGLLSLLPLAFTAAGFWPSITLAPTPMLVNVPPWAEPERAVAVGERSSPKNPLLLDPVSQFIPWRRAARRDLLFNPAQGSGAALVGNGQSAVLFPTEVLARWLSPFRAVTYSQAARLLLAGWGMFLLARALALSELAALAASTVWLGAGFLQLWRLHPQSLVAAVAAWILFALVELVRRPGPRPAVLLAAAGAVGLAGGHPETLLHTVLFGLLLVALLLVLGERAGLPPRRPARVAVWGVTGAVLSLLLAAPVLLPFVDNLAVSTEWRHRTTFGGIVEVPLRQALERLRPDVALLALGEPVGGTWHGPENLAEIGGGAAGAAALALAALAALRGRRRALAVGLLALGLVGLAVSIHLPGISWPFGKVPLLRESLLKRLSLWWLLAVSLAAGLGVDAWRRTAARPVVPWAPEPAGRGEAMPRWWGAVAAAAAAVAAALLWAAGAPTSAEPVILWTEWGALALAAGLVACRFRALSAALLLAVLLVPRVVLFDGWIPHAHALSFYAETPSVRLVQDRLAAAGPVGYRVAGMQGALLPQSAAFFGLSEVRVYDPMTFAPYADFLALVGEPVRTGWVQPRHPALPALAFLGVRYVFENPIFGDRKGVRVVYRAADALVYENPNALPRLFVPRAFVVRDDPSEALAAAAGIDDFAGRVVAGGAALAGLGPAGPGPRANPAAAVTELVVAPRRVTAAVDAPAAALVATSQPAIPGWRLRVDGREVAPVRVNGAFLGAVVPAGPHRLELTYAPLSWRVGLGLCALGLLLATALALPRRRPDVRPLRPLG